MWPDNETTDDLIGFQVHADLIRAVITNPRMLPTTVGIFGDWGGGKTSIMRMLERDLEPERWPVESAERTKYEKIAVVYANTWLFEGYDDAKAAILSSVLLELAQHKRFGPKLHDKVTSLLKSVNWMRLARLAMKHVALPAAGAFLTGGIGAVPAAVALATGLSSLLPAGPSDKERKTEAEGDGVDWSELINKDPSQTESLDVRTFRTRFRKMLTDGGIETLVVLVDDLDRCTPERIIENLEAVKLFLSVEQTAFVIGADRRIVEHAIRSRYAEQAIDSASDEQTRLLVKDYLEKLVQVPYSLPRLSASEIETYMALLFCQRDLGDPDFQTCLRASSDHRTKNRYGSFGYAAVRGALGDGSKVQADLGEALTLAAAAAPLIADGLKGNPRQVKRFLNALMLRKELARVAKLDNIKDAVLVKLMILEYAHTDLFTQLFNWQAQQDGHPKELAEFEAAFAGSGGDASEEESVKKLDSRWATASIRKWIAMEPLLGNVDLRDYFWIARDRLASTLAGISMVAPVVRSVLDGLLSESAPRRNAAMKSAASLDEEERLSLLNLLDQKIAREPGDKAGYDALRYLAEQGFPAAVELLAKILLERPLDKVPAAVGMDVVNLAASKADLRGILDPVREHLATSNTLVGRAVKSARGPRK